MPPLQSLNVKHFMIAHLLAQGKSQAEAARRLSISPVTIYNCLETPEFQSLLEELKSEYAEKLAEKVILPFTEMQRRVDQEALGALNRLVSLSETGSKEDSVRLKANLALMDRSSNTPKQAIVNPPDAERDFFSVSVVQLVLETALQVGDKGILRSAQSALSQIPARDASHLPPIDVGSSPDPQSPPPSSPFTLKPLDQAIFEAEFSEEDSL